MPKNILGMNVVTFATPIPCGAILGLEQLNALCVDSCYSSLLSTRGTIQQGCTASTDIIVYDDIAYPATYVVDNFIFTYDVSCRKDSSSGDFCDPLFTSWLNETTLTSAQSCSSCFLGVQSVQLNSPLGYDETFAANFQSLTSSCGASGYPFTSPTAYALNGTATITAPASSTTAFTTSCTASYTVQDGDDCNSVARAHNVSTFSLLYENMLNIYCMDFPSAGTSLCLPQQCAVYTVQPGDECDSIVNSTAGITVTQLLAWNPNIESLCGNILGLAGNEICISPPGGFYDPTATTNPTASHAITAVPAPTNAMTGSNANCGTWYTIQEGDTCSLVSIANSIALSDFYFLNPEIDQNCTNLVLAEAYCVEAVGSISTYSGYSATGFLITLTTASATLDPPTTASTPYAGTFTPVPMLPTAPGSLPNCDTYRNYVDVGGSTTNALNECAYIAYAYGVQVSDLETWNPSLSNESCCLQPGYSYCVQMTPLGIDPTVTDDGCQPINQTTPGTVSSCQCWMNVYGYSNESYPCQVIADDYSITLSNLMDWNSWIGPNCDTGLYANLGYQDERAVCIGVNASTPTASALPTSSTANMATTTSAPMGPTQAGIVAGCLQFYTVQSGDSCAAIDSTYGITFNQFYGWNPAGKSTTTLETFADPLVTRAYTDR
ncbi:hypothetical protein MMC30_002698 [Trapelia coarctata]|nr:hypothetical protein [Trapelia coarctata]